MEWLSKKLSIFLIAGRLYSIQISITSWMVPFIFAGIKGGSLKYGVIALIGIIFLHIATNMFDDIIDYILEKRKIDKGLKQDFNFQAGKCICIFNGSLPLKNYIYVSLTLFILAFIIGLYFINIYGLELLYIIIPTIILCLLYPILGSLGLGEVIIALIFSPLLYLGVYFVMMGYYSTDILLLSISTGALTVAILHTHMLLDYKIDESNRKTTLCRLCKSQKNAYLLLCFIVLFAYLNIVICYLLGKLNIYYFITFLSLTTAFYLLKVMYVHIKNPAQEIKTNIFMGNLKAIDKVPENQKNFILKFVLVRNLVSNFTILLCMAIIITEILDKCIL